MSTGVAAVVLANAVLAALGTGLLPFMRLADSPRQLLTRLPLGYGVGLAAGGILVAHLQLVHLPLGRVGLPLVALVSLGLGLWRVRGTAPAARARWRPEDVAALVVLGAAAAFVVPAARLFVVKPLVESDGWVIWATRARTLYEYGHPIGPVFTDAAVPALQYPLLLPSLEAVAFRFMGRFDETLVHLQLLGLAIGFVGGAWVLLRAHTPPLLLAATLLALVTAPSFFLQLETNFADVPVAMLIALGVASLAAWLRTDAAGLLPAASLFLAAGALTKNEGELFALCAYIAAFLVARAPQRRPLLWAALATLALELPWRIWVQAHGLETADYSLSNLFDPGYLNGHRDRVVPAAEELLTQIGRVGAWSYVVPLVVAGFAGALILRRTRVLAFGVAWALLSFAGLLAIYWISINPIEDHLFNSSDRTIVTLVFGCALLVPVLLAPEREPEPG